MAKKITKKKEVKQVQIPTVQSLLAQLPQAMENVGKVKVVVGRQFTRSSGTVGYPVTVLDTVDGSPTKGISLVGFATEGQNGLFMREFSQLRIQLPELWNRIVNKPARALYEKAINENRAQAVAGGFLYTAIPAQSGKGVRVFVRVIDPKSPLFLQSFTIFAGPSRFGEDLYVIPAPNRTYGVAQIELPPRTQQMAQIVPVRDEKGQLVRGENGQLVLETGPARWVTSVRGALDAAAFIMEQALIAHAVAAAQKLIEKAEEDVLEIA